MKQLLYFCISSLMLLSGCVRASDSTAPIPMPTRHIEANSVYYWKTTFRLDSLERDFIAKHNIRKMYIRFFDVVAQDLQMNGDVDFIPNATIKFVDPVPQSILSVVPTVYITLDALKLMEGREAEAAEKIVQRVCNMMSYNEIYNVAELQLDCDWTATTEPIYFELCRQARKKVEELFSTPLLLSSTIRLHQLKLNAPPVDYGVLMMYNTGSFKNPKAENSILSYNDVAPYLKKPVNYPLHLDVAYPAYEWVLAYRQGSFVGILSNDSIHHEDINADRIRREKSDINTIMRVKKLVDKQVLAHQDNFSTIIYHLDSKNLKSYSENEISSIYNCDNI